MDTYFLVYPEESATFLRRSILYGLLAGSALCLPTYIILSSPPHALLPSLPFITNLVLSLYQSLPSSNDIAHIIVALLSLITGLEVDASSLTDYYQPSSSSSSSLMDASNMTNKKGDDVGLVCRPALQAFLTFRLLLWTLQVPLRVWFWWKLGQALRATTRRTLVDSLLRLTSSPGWRFNQYIGLPANLAFALVTILLWKRPACGDPSNAAAPYVLYRMTVGHIISFTLHLFGCFVWFRRMHRREELMIQLQAEVAAAGGDAAAAVAQPANTRLNDELISQYTSITLYNIHSVTSDSCSICMSTYEDGDRVRVLPCSHDYHSKCFDGWLRVKAKCPRCTRDITEPANVTAMATLASLRDDRVAAAIVATMITRIIDNVVHQRMPPPLSLSSPSPSPSPVLSSSPSTSTETIVTSPSTDSERETKVSRVVTPSVSSI